jgi:hypothetical protein
LQTATGIDIADALAAHLLSMLAPRRSRRAPAAKRAATGR